jgi:hypothetical protein
MSSLVPLSLPSAPVCVPSALAEAELSGEVVVAAEVDVVVPPLPSADADESPDAPSEPSAPVSLPLPPPHASATARHETPSEDRSEHRMTSSVAAGRAAVA